MALPILTLVYLIIGLVKQDGSALSDQDVVDMAKTFLTMRKSVKVLNGNMSYLDYGPANATHVAVFLHGNPTSAYLWRNIVPYLVQHGIRCVAPDLIGMGYSSKIPNSWYYISDHARYLDEWFSLVPLPKKINLVLHDWGGPLGFNWAYEHRNRIQSVTFFEAFVVVEDETSVLHTVETLKKIWSPAGEELTLYSNVFLDLLLNFLMAGHLTEADKAEYMKPYLEQGEARRPVLTLPREVPLASRERNCIVNKMVSKYSKWLAKTDKFPKHAIFGYPGFFTPLIARSVQNWTNIEFTTLTADRELKHYFSEDAPRPLGEAIEKFLVKILKIETQQ